MYIIAEIGINHNGDLQTALNLISMAKSAGCDCVKFQKRNPDVCVPEEQKDQPKVFNGKEMTYLEYKHLIEFGEMEYDRIAQYCHEIDIDWTVSVWDPDSARFMKRYEEDIPFIKIPSACITDMELIETINNELNVPVIMSNGMSTQAEVDKAIQSIKNLKGILHCNSSYPSNPKELDLKVITTYQNLYPGLKIGYSGHDTDNMPSIIAAALGSEILERHITLDNEMEGSDHKASLDPIGLRCLMDSLRELEDMLGSPVIKVYASEEKVKQKLRRV